MADDAQLDRLAALAARAPTRSWCSPAQASPRSRASPTSADRRGSGPRIRGAERKATIQHYVADPEHRRAGVAQPGRAASCSRGEPNAGHRRARRARAACQPAHARHPERRRPAPGRGHVARDRHRDPRHRARGEVPRRAAGAARWRRPSSACAPATTIPRASSAAGMLKSATISFGENLVPADLERAQRAAAGADVFLAVGTSLGRVPGGGAPRARAEARSVPGRAQRRGDAVRPVGRVRVPRPAGRRAPGSRRARLTAETRGPARVGNTRPSR